MLHDFLLRCIFFFSAICAAYSVVTMASTLGQPITKDTARERLVGRGEELVRLSMIGMVVSVGWCAIILTRWPWDPWNTAFENAPATMLGAIETLLLGYYISQVPNSLEARVTSLFETFSFDLKNTQDVRDKLVSLLRNARSEESEVYILSAAPVPLIELATDQKDELFELLQERVNNRWPTAFLVYSWLDDIEHRQTTAGIFFQAMAHRSGGDHGLNENGYREIFARSMRFLNKLIDTSFIKAGPEDIVNKLEDVCIRLLSRSKIQFNPDSISMTVIIRARRSSAYSYVVISGTAESLSDRRSLPVEGGALPAAARRLLVEFNEKWRQGDPLATGQRTVAQCREDERLIEAFRSGAEPRTFDVCGKHVTESVDVFPISLSTEAPLFVRVARCLLQEFAKCGERAQLVDLGCASGAIGIACAELSAKVTFVDRVNTAVLLTKTNLIGNDITQKIQCNVIHREAVTWVYEEFSKSETENLDAGEAPFLIVCNLPLYQSPLNLYNRGNQDQPLEVLRSLVDTFEGNQKWKRTLLLVAFSPELSTPGLDTLDEIKPHLTVVPLAFENGIRILGMYSHDSIWGGAINAARAKLASPPS